MSGRLLLQARVYYAYSDASEHRYDAQDVIMHYQENTREGQQEGGCEEHSPVKRAGFGSAAFPG
jgi:hypothetical protein